MSNRLPAKPPAPPVEVHEKRGRGPGRPFAKGNDGGPGRPPNGYRQRARFWEERSKGLEVMARIVSGDILEYLGEKDGELIFGPTRNGDRISAYKELRDSAGYAPPRASIEVPEGSVTFVIVTPRKAVSAEQWLKRHKQGAA